MIRRDFNPGFYVEHFIKDLAIALEEAERLNLNLPGLALAKQLYDEVSKQGHSRLGTHALLLAMEAKQKSKNPKVQSSKRPKG